MPHKPHHTRKHAQWSASATARNWLCPGNLAFAADVTLPPESKAAAWGTACHEVAEKLLTRKLVAIGDEIETDRHVFYVDQDMLDCAYVYVDYIRERITNGYDLLAIEKEFSLAGLGLPMDIGGTADCVLYHPHMKVIEIVDLKTGKGNAVEAIENPQERLYALGVLVSMDLTSTPVDSIQTTIVQPRFAHANGPVRSETVALGELMDWTIDLAPRVNMAAEALKSYARVRNVPEDLDDWVNKYLVPGEEQCQFCPAAGSCPALRRNALEIAGAWQDDKGTIHFKSNLFPDNSPESVEMDLDMFEHLEGWVRERRALAHEMASQGHRFDHWSLVEKIGHRKFSGATEADNVRAIMDRLPLDDSQMYDRKLKSPAGFEREIGKAAVEAHLADLIIRPVTGTDLIKTSNTARTPVPSVIELLQKGE
jgi:uncharacterized protein DUF2800